MAGTAVFERMAEAISVYTDEGICLYLNPAAERMSGRARAEWVGACLWELFPKALDDPFHEAFERVAAQGRTEDFEHHHELSGRCFFSRIFRVDGLVHVVTRDATDQRRSEADRAVLVEQAQRARQEAEEAQRRTELLLAVARELSEPVKPEAALSKLAELAVRAFADWCTICLIEGDGSLKRVRAVHKDADKQGAAHQLLEKYPPSLLGGKDLDGVAPRVHPVLTPEVTEEHLVRVAQSPEHLELMLTLGVASSILVPLAARGTPMGVISLVRSDPNYPYTETDLALAQKMASRAALALENARLYERLSESDKTLRAIIEASPVGIFFCDGAQRITVANDTFLRMLGYSREDFDARPLDAGAIVPHEHLPSSDDNRDTVVATGHVGPVEREYLRKDGTRLSALVSAVHLGGGRIAVLALDIADRKKIEEQNRFLAEASAILASSLDYNKTLESIAQLAVPILADWATVDMLGEGNTIKRIAVAHPDPARVKQAIDYHARYPTHFDSVVGVGRVLRTGESEWVAHIPDAAYDAIPDARHRADARALGIKSYLSVPLSSRGRVLGALTLVYADSKRRYGEADLALAEDLGRRAAMAVDNALLFKEATEAAFEHKRRVEFEQQLIGIVSHDLRNPLSAIGMIASLLLRRGGLDDKQAASISKIIGTTDRAQRLIRDFLDFTQAREAGGIPITRSLTNVHEVARAVVDEVHLVHPERRVLVEHSGDGNSACDTDRISQIIGNLVANAFQHSPPDAIIRVATAGEDDGVVLTVQNEGPPIPSEDLARLFEPFQRGRDARAFPVRSIGLGLFITKQLVNAHGAVSRRAPLPGRALPSP